MHHTNPVARTVFRGLLLALLLGGVAVAASAQEKLPTPVGVLTVPVEGTQPLQMSKKQIIKEFVIPREGVIRAAGKVNDPRTLMITGLAPGTVTITLTDEAGNKEVFDVIVQLDVQYLNTVLRQAIPTANIRPIPGANNTIILTGWVARAEDINTVVELARSQVGGTIIPALRIGGVQQVQLEVVVALVSRTEVRRMAFNFLADSRNFFIASTVGQSVGTPALAGVGSPTLTVNGVLAGVPGVPNGSPTNLFLGVLHPTWGFLQFLQALEDENLAKVLAAPTVVVLSGRPASFLVGGEQAIPVPAGLGQIGVQFEEFGTRLNFLPIVMGNGKIHLEVEPEVSSLNAAFGTAISGTIVPGRSTQRVHTTVELEDGQTFAIGGLIQHNVTGTVTKLPVLGSLPVVGVAFSSKSYQDQEQELVVLVTPRLVDAMSCDQVPKLLPGQETRKPDDLELFLGGILEAPRGPRQVFHGHRYIPAWKNGPSAAVFPCAGNGHCGNGHGDSNCEAAAGTMNMQPAPAPLPLSMENNPPAMPPLPGQDVVPTRASGPAARGPMDSPSRPAMLPPVQNE
jgi:pilus assembly protein CpaC